MEEELSKNEIWNNLINSLTNLSQLFQDCYNLLTNISKDNTNYNNNNSNNYNSIKKNKINNHSSLKKTNDKTPSQDIIQNDSFKITESNDNNDDNEVNNINIKRNQQLLFEIEKYKEDNRIIYKNYKKLENENIELFFVNKENKFYYKLITRMLQYHINNLEVKNIINKLVLLNGKAISLDIEKNKIKIKIDDICSLISSSSSNGNKMDIKAIDHNVNVLAMKKNGKRYGMCVAWATQISADHILCAVGGQSSTGNAPRFFNPTELVYLKWQGK